MKRLLLASLFLILSWQGVTAQKIMQKIDKTCDEFWLSTIQRWPNAAERIFGKSIGNMSAYDVEQAVRIVAYCQENHRSTATSPVLSSIMNQLNAQKSALEHENLVKTVVGQQKLTTMLEELHSLGPDEQGIKRLREIDVEHQALVREMPADVSASLRALNDKFVAEYAVAETRVKTVMGQQKLTTMLEELHSLGPDEQGIKRLREIDVEHQALVREMPADVSASLRALNDKFVAEYEVAETRVKTVMGQQKLTTMLEELHSLGTDEQGIKRLREIDVEHQALVREMPTDVSASLRALNDKFVAEYKDREIAVGKLEEQLRQKAATEEEKRRQQAEAEEKKRETESTLYLLLFVYIGLSGLISLTVVRRPFVNWWNRQFIFVAGTSMVDVIWRRFLYRLAFELFIYAAACVFGALGGWIYVVMQLKNSMTSPTDSASIQTVPELKTQKNKEIDEGGRSKIRSDPVRCPSCHREMAAKNKFCPYCGAEASAKCIINCPKCNTEVPPGARFCPSCRYALHDGNA